MFKILPYSIYACIHVIIYLFIQAPFKHQGYGGEKVSHDF